MGATKAVCEMVGYNCYLMSVAGGTTKARGNEGV